MGYLQIKSNAWLIINCNLNFKKFELPTLSKVDLLDGPCTTVALDELDALDGLWHEFRDQVVGIDN